MMAKTTKMKVVSNDGAEFLDAVTKPITSADGWSNSVTGMGYVGRDKGESTQWQPSPILGYQRLDSMGRGDGFSRIIVDTVVDDAMRAGWTVNFTGDDDTEITPEESHELNEKLQKRYKETKLKSRVSQHLKQARQYGGAVLALGVKDGQDPSMPLDVEKITGFDWMRSHDRHQAQQSMQVNDDPTSPGFGFAEAYTLHAATIQSGDRDETLLDTWVHNSRVWRTDGVFLSERVRQQNEGWGDSVLQVCVDQLGNRSSAMKSARTVIQEWVQGVYKIKNLAGIIAANGETTVRARFSIMDRLKSAWQAIIVDADAEDYQRIATTAAGMPEVLDRFGMDLAAVARMPMTKLFGLSPGGFGTGEAEGDNWDDVTQSYQTDTIEPLLEYVHKLILATPEFADFPKNFSINFNPLQLTSPVEQADVRLKTSQADALDISSGVLAADEVGISRYAGASYSTETTLDIEGRRMDVALEEQGLGSASSEPFTGIQISSMLDILERVKTGTLPKESALTALGVAFPTMSPEAAAGMVNPIEVTGPIEVPGRNPFGAPKPTPNEADDGGGQ